MWLARTTDGFYSPSARPSSIWGDDADGDGDRRVPHTEGIYNLLVFSYLPARLSPSTALSACLATATVFPGGVEEMTGWIIHMFLHMRAIVSVTLRRRSIVISTSFPIL